VPVDAHEGSRAAFLTRIAAEGAAAAASGAAVGFLGDAFQYLADSRVLYTATEHVARDGGPARGVDGVGPADLDAHAIRNLVPQLRHDLRAGTYRPGPVRRVDVPKPAGGIRTLSVPTVADRVLERAVVTVLTPFLDPQFSPTTFGGRPGGSTAGAIAVVAAHVDRVRCPVVVTADVRKAFDSVPHDRLVSVVRARLGITPMTHLLETLIRGRGENGRGLAQGGAASMLLVNLYLDELVDRPWRERHPDRPLVRWVDDLLIPAADLTEGRALSEELAGLIAAAGLTLKDGAEATDLCTKGVEWLGVELGVGTTGRFEARIAESSLTQLQEHLHTAHQENTPGVRARQTTIGWMTQQGPSYQTEDRTTLINRIQTKLAETDFPGVVTTDEILTPWAQANTRYEEHYRTVLDSLALQRGFPESR
jgi:retron-type reverse transcriptase